MTDLLIDALRHDGRADKVKILIPGGGEAGLEVKNRVPGGKTFKLFTRLCSPSEDEAPAGAIKIETNEMRRMACTHSPRAPSKP